METPEFLLWAIEHRCPVRAQQDGSDPERTERQLRAARAASDARREGRVFEGLCIDPPEGFRLAEALAVYGGLHAAESACRNCPANALAELEAPGQLTEGLATLAGCYGLVPLPPDPQPVHAAIERGIEIAAPGEKFDTRPRWYGLWLASPLWAELLFQTWLILDASAIEDHHCQAVIQELKAGLNAAFNTDARLHVKLFPRGRVVDGKWELVPHCPRCKAEWINSSSRQCAVCRYAGHPADDKKRLARGTRPYFPLDRLLGKEQAAEFLVRYEAFRARPASQDRALDRQQPRRPDNPPAD